MNVNEAGYIFVYLSYENASNNYVYFDDFKVTHTKSNIVQSNEYYPFGQLAAGSWTRENAADNRYLANGGTELNRTSNLYDLEYRNYDPILGRLHQVDPTCPPKPWRRRMASKYASVTPYNYSFNNAVNLTDPSGADPYNHSPGTWFGGGHYTYDDVMPNRGSDGWSQATGRAGMTGGDGWMEYSSSMMQGGMGRYWHSGDGRLYWSSYEASVRILKADASAVKSGDMSLDQYANKYGAQYGSGLNAIGNGLLSLGVQLVPLEYLAKASPDGPQGEEREGFVGGRLYGKDELWRAFADIWYASRRINGKYLENAGVFTDVGLLVLPNAGNKPDSPDGSLIFLNQIVSKDHKTVRFADKTLQAWGYIHTHPDPGKAQKHSELPRWSSEWMWQDRKIGNYVLSTEGLFKAENDISFFIGDPFASGQTNYVMNYLNQLYNKK